MDDLQTAAGSRENVLGRSFYPMIVVEVLLIGPGLLMTGPAARDVSGGGLLTPAPNGACMYLAS